ncbi:CoA-binding protein [Muriicola soli]|uniref:CoA-binding protein n=1 Tax=Muriicola soli TaxID=2507538 RepID=A0A411E7H3_9FLAO|nr:CoA-binding protein [Muriicola soli]QBA63598.1 CoA-binding protein [Muriicola soli]
MNKTLVFGASLKPYRYSHVAIKRLVEAGEVVVAFGLREGLVAGVQIETRLDRFEQIDTVTLYMNPKRQKQFYQDIINLHPRRVIFNPGTENPEFYNLLREAGIEVEVACTLVLLSIGQYN